MELSEGLRVLFGLIAVLGLIGLAALIARKAGLASMSSAIGRKRRLSVVETLALDGRRRMLIIKCDDAEHLIVLGANGETVVEKNIYGATPNEAEPPAVENPFSSFKTLSDKFRGSIKDAA